MSASPEELIAINSLLIEREAAFARVHNLEGQINELLGGDYPFLPPSVTIPSTIKKKKAKAKKAAANARALKPRRLNEDEVGYRMTWIEKSQTTQSNVADLRSLNNLLQEGLPGMKLLKIETVHLDGTTVETLFETQSHS